MVVLGSFAQKGRFPTHGRRIGHVALAVHTGIGLVNMLRAFDLRIPPCPYSILASLYAADGAITPTVHFLAKEMTDSIDGRVAEVAREVEDRLEDTIEGPLR